MAKKYTPPHIKASKKGSLHTALGVKKGNKIPASKLKIKSTDSPALKKKKQFAINAKKWKHQAGGDTRDVHFIKMSISQAQEGGFVPKEDPNNPGFDLQGNPITRSSQDYPELEQNPDANIDVVGNLAAQQKQRQQQGNDPNQPLKKIAFLDSPQGKAFNQGVRGITNVANSIQNNKLKHQEKLQLNESMTPRFMSNPNSQGANNAPAYTMYGGEMKMGGPISHGSPIGVVDSNSGGPGLDESMYEGYNHNSFYGQDMIYSGEMPRYKTGGTVSAAKAKEILRDGTAQGHPLTDKQKRYFGWIAGSSKQTGGQNPPPAGDPNDPNGYYQASAIYQYDKTLLNNKLRSKDPKAYDTYQGGFNDINSQVQQGKLSAAQFIPKRQDYVENSDYNQELTPEEIKATLGDKYPQYLQTLQTVNKQNIARGQKPLFGTKEGDVPVDQQRYGRRFAAVTTNPSVDYPTMNQNGPKTMNRRTYTYDPNSRKVNSNVSQLDANGQVIQPQQVASRQTGGYSVGDEVELSAQEIKELKKQGYKIENI